MRLLLVRHGQTPANVEGILDTAVPGPGLTALGRRQAAALPAALAGEEIGAIVVTDLVRTHETAAPLAAALGLEPVEVGELREIDAGDLEGRNDREAVAAYIGSLVAWAGGDVDRRVPGGETGTEFFARYDRGVARVAALGHDTVAVVSHGAAIRGWATARGLDREASPLTGHELDNTGVVTLEGDPATGWRVVDWRTEPAAGSGLADESAPDPTGDAG